MLVRSLAPPLQLHVYSVSTGGYLHWQMSAGDFLGTTVIVKTQLRIGLRPIALIWPSQAVVRRPSRYMAEAGEGPEGEIAAARQSLSLALSGGQPP
jgi:hypothetical protein